MHTNRHSPQFETRSICEAGLRFQAQSSQTGSHLSEISELDVQYHPPWRKILSLQEAVISHIRVLGCSSPEDDWLRAQRWPHTPAASTNGLNSRPASVSRYSKRPALSETSRLMIPTSSRVL